MKYFIKKTLLGSALLTISAFAVVAQADPVLPTGRCTTTLTCEEQFTYFTDHMQDPYSLALADLNSNKITQAQFYTIANEQYAMMGAVLPPHYNSANPLASSYLLQWAISDLKNIEYQLSYYASGDK